MQQKRKAITAVAVASVVLLTAARWLWPAQSGGYAVVLCAAVAAVLALFVLCGKQRRELVLTGGVPCSLLAGAAMVCGVALAVFSAENAMGWLLRGEHPYPQPSTVTVITQLVTAVLAASGIAGGVFLVTVAQRWLREGQTNRHANAAAALLPVVWTWARLLWYMTSFTSAVNRFRSVLEVAVLVLEMLFLLAFARYVSGVEEQPPRFTVSVALSTAVLGLIVCFTRLGAWLGQNAALFADTAPVTVADWGVALLAAAFAVSQLFPAPLPEELPITDEDDEDILPEGVLLHEEFWLADTPPADEEEEYEELSDEERRPMELEDVINSMIADKIEK